MTTTQKQTQTQHKYAWVPDLPDFRDFTYMVKMPLKSLPLKIDLRPGCSKVEDQGNLGSCTANALVGALEFNQNKNKTSFVDMSRLFIYYNERVIEGAVRTDAGASLRDGIKTLAKQGCCSETFWPYTINKFATKPTAACYTEGLKNVIQSYSRINTLDDMRGCIASGEPFVFGFSVYTSFESDAVAKTGVLNMPSRREKMLGGHAVLAVGYDDLSKRFIVRNSWGPDWGQAGYFTIPYDYLNNKNLADDMWHINK
jgi:C1A family cysteine protease